MARKFTLKSRTAAGDIDFSADLNPEQVVAGAGSGKTRALTYRLAWLVHHGIEPGRIMLVTFTNRAAREMLSRVEVLVKQRTSKDLLASCVQEAGVDTKQRRFPQKNVLAAISSFVQNTLHPLETVISTRFPMFIQELDGIEKVLVLYTAKKRPRQLLDFDDLLSAAAASGLRRSAERLAATDERARRRARDARRPVPAHSRR